ncbi:hypothetical protein [Saccharothrix texasensis]|uniref:hypothetical protein n=1 Tax=Saccharothrix texasensis TaxID=103734 RepID=UPI001FEA978F|nr:hypothetical protein [Saccharothrix texasensis]
MRSGVGPPVATTEPTYRPSCEPSRVSAVTEAVAAPPAGTVTFAGDTPTRPAGAVSPSGPVTWVASDNVSGAAPSLR